MRYVLAVRRLEGAAGKSRAVEANPTLWNQSFPCGSRNSHQEARMLALKMNYSPAITSSSLDGLVLLNSGLKPIFINHHAAEILTYPHRPETRDCADFLASRIRSLFSPEQTTVSGNMTTTFRSGRRIYEGRAYRVNPLAKAESQVSVAILLQRRQRTLTAFGDISQRFNLTTREQQVLEYITHGMTTKEIASGLNISPNTVKNFVRMLMVKMGVSTRSGLVGKALWTDDSARREKTFSAARL